MTGLWGKIYRGIGYSVATFIIVYATLVNVAYLFTPYLNAHKAEFETWGSQLLKTPITIGHVAVAWNRFEPEIELANVTILNKDTHQPTIGLHRVNIHLEVWRSLFTWHPQVESIKIGGAHLTIHEFKTGQFHIEGLRELTITDDFTGASMKSDTVLGWIFSVSRLGLQEIDIQYIPQVGTPKSVTLDRLSLANDNKNHVLTGLALLNQEVPTKVDIDLKWTGDFSDLEHVSADLNLYLEAISLSQFLKGKSWHQLQVLEGLGSAKINLRWDANQLQHVRTQVQIYELELKSLITKKTQLFSRISGNMSWRQEGANQIVSGDEILIDFPDHLWPSTSFKAVFTPSATNDFELQALDVGYLNLPDVTLIVMNSGFLSDAMQKIVTKLNLNGELRALHTQTMNGWNDPTQFSFATEFSHLDLTEWNKLPGLANLTGSIAWNGKQGSLKLNSRQTQLSLSSVFAKPLSLNQLSGYLDWEKDTKNNNWNVNAKNIFIVSPDVRIKASATMTFPENQSPSINLASDFDVSHVENIPNYLPVRKMDSELVSWLKSSLRGGSIDYGKVVIQGRLSDFAAGNAAGKIQVSGIVKNVDLNYAPKWPALRNMDGKINFTGQIMTIDLTSAQINEVPVKQLHAVLDHFNDQQPTILSLQAQLQSTLNQGVQFVVASPLNDMLGKELQSMHMQGPMNLTLGLTMPAKKPEEIKIHGAINTVGAVLNLEDWNMLLDQLQGTFQFTENDIQAKDIKAQLFGKPVDLSISTQHTGKATTMVADLQGEIDIPTVQKWLKLSSLADYAQGSTNYKAELRLLSHEKNLPNEIILTSNLKGISVKLPEQYGKKSEDPIDFRLDVLIAQNQPLKVKMDYGKLISAAVTLKNQRQNWFLQGGELRLGPGATWQTQPGILISGKVDVLDWEKLQKEFEAQKTTTSATPASFFAVGGQGGAAIRQINLDIGSLIVFGHEFKRINVQLEKAKNNWEIGLNSESIRGRVTVPFDLDQEGIQCRFDRIYLISSNSNVQNNLDPKKIPAISFVGDDVRLDDKSFGRVSFETVPSGSGMNIKALNIRSAVMELNATGYWQSTRTGAMTNIRGEASTKKVSQVLTAWGFNSDNFVGGVGNVKFDLSWPSAPFDPTQKGLTGKLSLHLGEGRIVNVGDNGAKIGLGRMLSLFSLQTIPRRLSLDFSDLFEKGYSFDSMNADVTFKNGNAYTDNVRLDGPVAEIAIAGRIGIVAKDFDVKLGVTPHMTSSLPVVATFAVGGFNPLFGAAAWMFDKVVSRSVSSVTTYQYRITGPWDNPDWSQLHSGK